jgi:DNA polymerase III subunit beta
MEFKINQVEFSNAVTEVSRAVSGKATIPILTGIKIEAKENALSLVGRNNDIVIEKVIPVSEKVEIVKNGSIVVSARLLNELIKKLPSDLHVMVTNNHSVKILAGEIVTTINGVDAEEFPTLPELNLSKRFTITGKELINIVKHTVFAASKNETKPVLTGIQFTLQHDTLTSVATNSQRLSLIKHSVHTELNESFILPSKALTEIGKLFHDYSSEIQVFITNTTIMFQANHLTVYSKLIDGNYPSVLSLIPQESKTTITLQTKDLLDAINRASIFASESRNNTINLQLTDQSKLVISSNSSSIGGIQETLNVKDFSGDMELSVTVDGRYMKDALGVIDLEEIMLSFNGAFKPILIHPVGHYSNLQLISPVRA